MPRCAAAVAMMLLFTAPVFAQSAAETALLPPVIPWDGASKALVVPKDDPWVTPAEASDFASTPRYDDVAAWLQKLAAAAPEVKLVSLGKSGQGRDLWMAVVTAEGAATPEALAQNGRPTLLAQGGIHAGEIDGKDAGLMLLRDLTVRGTKKALLQSANFLFVPIFNVDGHERVSRFGRINQRGPAEMGWRTTAVNLNLNRDYAKADAPEMQAMIKALNAWDPHLYVDLHVTDGVDYQYDITWGFPGRHATSPNAAGWLETVLNPALLTDLKAQGHIPSILFFPAGNDDMSGGLFLWTAQARFSDGYGSLRHLPTVLVENHSLKPYDQRVLGTYVLLETMLATLGKEGKALREAIAADNALRPERVPLAWRPPADQPPATVEFLGIESRREPSAITGTDKVVWTGNPVTQTLPRVAATEVAASVARPKAYFIPPQWREVILRLSYHGIQLQRLSQPAALEVGMYRIEGAQLDPQPFEGRAVVKGTPKLEKRMETFPAGTIRVPTDQPLGDLAVVLLEPESNDSFFRWGFFLEILQRTEYVEAYVMEPMAEKMLAENPELKAEWDKALADPEFAKDPGARLRWFYQRTPFADDRWLLYPIAREE